MVRFIKNRFGPGQLQNSGRLVIQPTLVGRDTHNPRVVKSNPGENESVSVKKWFGLPDRFKPSDCKFHTCNLLIKTAKAML